MNAAAPRSLGEVNSNTKHNTLTLTLNISLNELPPMYSSKIAGCSG